MTYPYKLSITINPKNDLKIFIHLYNLNADLKPLLIFSHGFKGFRDWGGFPYMMNKFSQNNFAAASFNFTHNGISEDNPDEFTRLDLFAENTISKEVNELNSVINYFYENAEKYNIDKNRIGLIGHSRGGGISIISASECPQVKALVTLASVSDFDRFTDEQKAKWKKNSFIEIPNTRTNQLMKMNISYLNDLEQNKQRLNILNSVKKLSIPFFIIHGKEDLAVKYSEAEAIYNVSDKNNTVLNIIENTGHTFSIEHPFKGTTEAFEKIIELSCNFFKNTL
jgi:esterase/lipase